MSAVTDTTSSTLDGPSTSADARALLARVTEMIGKAQGDEARLLERARAMANESGIARARSALAGSLDIIANAQERRRAADTTEREAKEALDAALAEAEWVLGDCFEVRSNKTYLVKDDPAGAFLPEARSMDATERRAWITRQSARQPVVARAQADLRTATEAAASARDDLSLAERRFQAAHHDLSASVALLTVLQTALQGGSR